MLIILACSLSEVLFITSPQSAYNQPRGVDREFTELAALSRFCEKSCWDTKKEIYFHELLIVIVMMINFMSALFIQTNNYRYKKTSEVLRLTPSRTIEAWITGTLKMFPMSSNGKSNKAYLKPSRVFCGDKHSVYFRLYKSHRDTKRILKMFTTQTDIIGKKEFTSVL